MHHWYFYCRIQAIVKMVGRILILGALEHYAVPIVGKMHVLVGVLCRSLVLSFEIRINESNFRQMLKIWRA